MNYNPKELKALPDIISKEEFRRVCHISKRTATFLLQSGLVPCEKSDKKTRCFSIQKSDVLFYLEERKNHPFKYATPQNWYRNAKYSDTFRFQSHMLTLDYPTMREMEIFYSELLADYPDVVDVEMIVKFTGYRRTTVGNWCRKKWIKTIMTEPKYMIPKVFLIEYFLSDLYNEVNRKSVKHLHHIWEIKNRVENKKL